MTPSRTAWTADLARAGRLPDFYFYRTNLHLPLIFIKYNCITVRRENKYLFVNLKKLARDNPVNDNIVNKM